MFKVRLYYRVKFVEQKYVIVPDPLIPKNDSFIMADFLKLEGFKISDFVT